MTSKNKFIGDDEEAKAWEVIKGQPDEDDEGDEEEPEDPEEAEDEFLEWSDEVDRKKARKDALTAIISAGVDVTQPPYGDEDDTPIMQRSDAYVIEFAKARVDGFNPDQERAENGQFGSGSGTSKVQGPTREKGEKKASATEKKTEKMQFQNKLSKKVGDLEAQAERNSKPEVQPGKKEDKEKRYTELNKRTNELRDKVIKNTATPEEREELKKGAREEADLARDPEIHEHVARHEFEAAHRIAKEQHAEDTRVAEERKKYFPDEKPEKVRLKLGENIRTGLKIKKGETFEQHYERYKASKGKERKDEEEQYVEEGTEGDSLRARIMKTCKECDTDEEAAQKIMRLIHET